MSTPSTEVISVIGYHIIQNYFEIAAAGLLLYDLAITLDEELQYMWLFRPPSMLFLLNRIDMLAMCACFLLKPFASQAILCTIELQSLNCALRYGHLVESPTMDRILFGLIPFIVNLFGAAQDSIVLYPLAQFGLCATTNRNSPTTSISVLLLVNILDLALVVTSALYVSSSSVIQAYNPLPVTIFPITSIIIARFTLDLRKLAAEAQNLESSKVVPLSNADEWQFMTSPMKPYKSIVRWNRECLDADPDMPAGFASVTGFTDDVEREGDAEMQVVHRVSLNA
ncbi:hypothetical protein EVJ58_g6243 [Rhodofomes roseus]|uniref:DUF6533 domain-containing protein n=1 Tax=Rhodofomes roseus TaxID=34475 RepID=A0A4Y9Y947_9APHY|nr:hypothetical protein EVJ58_g6243 [Rhodofomes roseus]